MRARGKWHYWLTGECLVVECLDGRLSVGEKVLVGVRCPSMAFGEGCLFLVDDIMMSWTE